MPTDVIMPALGMAQDTGKLLRWLKEPGATVAKGEPLMEIETDKVTVEVEAPADGVLAGVRAAEGADVPVGEVVALILAAGEHEESGNGAAPPAAERPRRALASPKARRLARELGVDLAALAGSGPHGAILAADVEGARPAAPAPAPAPAPAAELPVSSVWRTMAERTAASWREAPHFYLEREVEATRLLAWRDVARRRTGVQLTLTDLLVRVVARALRDHERLGASWRDGRLEGGGAVNVGLAVALDDGLVVPVLHEADRLDLRGIAERRTALVAAARERRLRLEDVTGGTFTISNLGMFGVDSFQAIVNAPQSGILAVGRIRDRVVPVDGRPEVRPTMSLTLSLDHRVVDGARGARFLETVAALVEEPAGLVD